MHELSITQSMLDLVLEEAKKVGAERVGKVNLVIGEMSGIVGECVEFYFEFLSQDTIAHGATLSFKKTPTQARCRNCGELFMPKEFDWSCPSCQDGSIEIVAGKELYVESIEVE
jgi:hydrogenase nickel incorporation protein HypA/HybF